jgi:hypothetical protein
MKYMVKPTSVAERRGRARWGEFFRDPAGGAGEAACGIASHGPFTLVLNGAAPK